MKLRLAAKASSTWGQYKPAFRRFAEWCTLWNREFMPASSETVELFLVDLARKSSSPHPSSMASAAISAEHKIRNLTSPCSAQSTRDVLEGIRRKYGFAATQREGLSENQLRQFIKIGLGGKIDFRKGTILQWRTVWFEWFGFRAQARWGDTKLLTIGQFYFSDNHLEVFFAERKNDKKKRGHRVYISKSGSGECLVDFTRMYIARLGLLNANEPHHLIMPKLTLVKGHYVAHQVFPRAETCRKEQSSILKSMELDPSKFGLHTPKVGGVRALRDAGFEWRDISDKVGWAANSQMPERYGKKSIVNNLKMDTEIWNKSK